MTDYKLKVAKRIPGGTMVTEWLSITADGNAAARAQADEMRADGRADGDCAYLWTAGDERFLGCIR